MCGRFGRSSSREAYERYFKVKRSSDPFLPTFNASPQSTQPVIRLDEEGERELRLMQWGLVPAWSSVPKVQYKTSNATSEDVLEKSAYREAVALIIICRRFLPISVV
jgi:putative SOS response-associated peptidase YedK